MARIKVPFRSRRNGGGPDLTPLAFDRIMFRKDVLVIYPSKTIVDAMRQTSRFFEAEYDETQNGFWIILTPREDGIKLREDASNKPQIHVAYPPGYTVTSTRDGSDQIEPAKFVNGEFKFRVPSHFEFTRI